MSEENEVKATEGARLKADTAGFDLAALVGKGTGKEGTITVPDVEKAIAGVEEAVEETVVITGAEERFKVHHNPLLGRIKHVPVDINGEERLVLPEDTLTASEYEEARKARSGPIYGHPDGVQMIRKGGRA